MRPPRASLTFAIAILLAACLAAFYWTNDQEASPDVAGAAVRVKPLVDTRLLRTARRLAELADTSEERDLARQALRLSDQEIDEAFASALRQAAAMPPAASGPLLQLSNRVAQLKARLAADQSLVAQLTKPAGAAPSDRLALAKAQQTLDQDQLDDTQQDLRRQGGNRHAALERELQDHEASGHQAAPVFPSGGAPPAATLSRQVSLWFDLNSRDRQLHAAEQQAEQNAEALLRQHQALEAQDGASKTPNPGAGATAAVALLQHLSDQTKTLSDDDQRIQNSQQLADVYGTWRAEVEGRRGTLLHRLFGSLAAVLAILLTVSLIDRAISHAFRQADRRRRHQMRTVSQLGVQGTGGLVILLVVFGPPTQLTTVIGLATAGLTVALKDFIVGFCGWFVLLGRNGIHLGDWVEIEGVSGEVIEIGLLRTVLLEIGSTTASGHPTGRRVAFMNSYAIEGHFFNFSTAGQWLWDELELTLPPGTDMYQLGERIAEVAHRETEAESQQAEEEWRRVTAQYGVREFSAKPSVDLRPGQVGLDVSVRYITRAPQRYEVKSRLLQVIVNLLQQRSAPAGARELA